MIKIIKLLLQKKVRKFPSFNGKKVSFLTPLIPIALQYIESTSLDDKLIA